MDEKNNTMFNLLDGASAIELSISKESKVLSGIVTDKDQPMIDRINAYEDIINIEVGDTSLTRARNIERETDLKQLYLKFEGGNPSGTQKDRIAFAQCLDALRRGYTTVTLATCGNYGAAMAKAAGLAGLKCIICIPESFHTLRIEEMKHSGSIIERYNGTYEETVVYSKELATENEYYDANPGGDNTALQLQAYAEISYEIYDMLRDAPKIVAVPVSNGTLLAGVYRGFVSLYKRGKTSRIPKMIAASTNKNNPIVHSIQKNFEDYSDLDPILISESKINEPLINWKSFDGNEAFYAVKDSNGSAFGISDHKLINQSKLLKSKEGLNVLPAATAGLVGLLELHKKEPLEGDRYVAILTAKK